MKTSLIWYNKERKYIVVTFINNCIKFMKNYIYTWLDEFNFKYYEKKAKGRCKIFSHETYLQCRK